MGDWRKYPPVDISTQEISILPSTPNDFWTNFSTQVGLLRFFGSSQTFLLQSLDAFKVLLYLINNRVSRSKINIIKQKISYLSMLLAGLGAGGGSAAGASSVQKKRASEMMLPK